MRIITTVLLTVLAVPGYGQSYEIKLPQGIPVDGQCLAFDSKTGSYGWTNCNTITCVSDTCSTDVPTPAHPNVILKTRPNVIPLNQIEQQAVKDANDDVKDAEDYLAWAHQEQQQIMGLIYEAEGIDKSTTGQWQVMDGEYLVRTGGFIQWNAGSYVYTGPTMENLK